LKKSLKIQFKKTVNFENQVDTQSNSFRSTFQSNFINKFKKSHAMSYGTKAIAECIEIHKINGHLGFSVWGGLDIDGAENPFQPGKKGIFVLEVDKNGPAATSGIRQGDQLLQIDGYDMTLATSKHCLKRLQKNRPVVRLIVTRNSLETSSNQPVSVPFDKNGTIASYSVLNEDVDKVKITDL